jgi:hypothetical protein
VRGVAEAHGRMHGGVSVPHARAREAADLRRWPRAGTRLMLLARPGDVDAGAPAGTRKHWAQMSCDAAVASLEAGVGDGVEERAGAWGDAGVLRGITKSFDRGALLAPGTSLKRREQGDQGMPSEVPAAAR